jgi:hypothetical protein
MYLRFVVAKIVRGPSRAHRVSHSGENFLLQGIGWTRTGKTFQLRRWQFPFETIFHLCVEARILFSVCAIFRFLIEDELLCQGILFPLYSSFS